MAKGIVFTDLDGTLLDDATYSAEAALSALHELKRQGIPVVFCTSKTFGETVAIQKYLEITDPFIVENGGAIYARKGTLPLPTEMVDGHRGSWQRIPLGVPYRSLVAHMQDLGKHLGITIRGFAQMSIEEICAECHLSFQEGVLAKQREFDEPFLIHGADEQARARIVERIRGSGLTVTEGARFAHLSGPTTKGQAIRRLLPMMAVDGAKPWTAAIGDSPNDISMFEAVDDAYLVMRPGHVHHRGVLESGVAVQRVPGVGPHGWAIAVVDLLTKHGHAQPV